MYSLTEARRLRSHRTVTFRGGGALELERSVGGDALGT
jgi:hypothetical protein